MGANRMAGGAPGARIGGRTASSLVQAGLARSPAAFREVNRQAIDRGWDLVTAGPGLGGMRGMLAHLGAPVLHEHNEVLLVGAS